MHRYSNRVIRRATRPGLAKCFAELKIEPGATICIHAAVSELGYLSEGPQSVIFALQDAVPQCTIMMPTFPFGGPAVGYVSSDPIYDPSRTPSAMGILSETLRQMPEARRSLHPTHPCAALGRNAGMLIDGSESSITPCGDSSTHGRLSARDDAVVLLIHTNNTSLVHRFQEIIDMPNLFLPEPYPVRGYGQNGQLRTYHLKIHVPDLPMYAAISRGTTGGVEYLWLADYVVQFPEARRQRVLSLIASPEAKQLLRDRQQTFFDTGVFRQATYGAAEILAIRLQPWQDRICRDLRQNLGTFAACYTRATLQTAKDTGLLRRLG